MNVMVKERHVKITLMDFKTNQTAVIEQDKRLEEHTVLSYYSVGNGGCDCNRSLDFDRVTGTDTSEEIESVIGEGVCFREERFVVVDVENYSGDKEEFIAESNGGYDKIVVDACIEEYQSQIKLKEKEL